MGGIVITPPLPIITPPIAYAYTPPKPGMAWDRRVAPHLACPPGVSPALPVSYGPAYPYLPKLLVYKTPRHRGTEARQRSLGRR